MTGFFNDTQLSGVRPALGQVRAARRMTKKIFLINSVPQSKTEGLYSYLIGDARLCLPMPKIVLHLIRADTPKEYCIAVATAKSIGYPPKK